MKLKTFKTLWGNTLPIDQACQQAHLANFDGIEGQPPKSASEQTQWLNALASNQCAYIAEIVTGEGYVPNRHWSVQQHLEDLEKQLILSIPLTPLFATAITGQDAWSEAQSIDYFEQAMQLAKKHNIEITFETHRSRSLFNPWVTQRIVEALPKIKLTLDISHWCVVCERLLDTEMEVINAIANNVHHIHGRIGYDQGPQVSHPAAPEYAAALKSHQVIWKKIWQAQFKKGYSFTTLTPEFGTDGYLPLLPFTQMPVADLWEINQWMNQVEKQHFSEVIFR